MEAKKKPVDVGQKAATFTKNRVSGIVKFKFDDDEPVLIGHIYNDQQFSFGIPTGQYIDFEDKVNGKKMTIFVEQTKEDGK
jgi:hypothetical protein